MNFNRIRVRENDLWNGIQIQMVSQQIGGWYYPDFSELPMKTISEGELIPSDSLFKLGETSARALYEELRRFYGEQSPDITKEIVTNLHSERERVDKMLGRILEGKLRIE